jgi:predicted small metal-binding protein
MKEFDCSDMVPGCEVRLRGETEEELLQVVTIHAQEAHGMAEVTPHMLEQVRAGMRDCEE